MTTFTSLLLSAQSPYTYVGNFYLLVEPITLSWTEEVSNERLFGLDYSTNLVFLTCSGMTYKITKYVYTKEISREITVIWE
ncbi:MAG: hypothetical protein ACQZ3N_09685 [cyanobacterium endosymbiont of Rhopalodia yunnanensis]